MSMANSVLTLTILCSIFIFVSGYWLSRTGKSYNTLSITIHKLISLCAGVLLSIYVLRLFQAGQLGTLEIIAAIATSLLFLSLAATGGLLSAGKPIPIMLSTFHKFFSYLTLVSSALTVYLLSFGS